MPSNMAFDDESRLSRSRGRLSAGQKIKVVLIERDGSSWPLNGNAAAWPAWNAVCFGLIFRCQQCRLFGERAASGKGKEN